MSQIHKDAEQVITQAKGQFLIEKLEGGIIRLTIYGRNTYGGTGQVAISLELSADNIKQFEKALAGDERLRLKMPGGGKGAFGALSPGGLADALMREKEFAGDLYLGNLMSKRFRRECGFRSPINEQAGMAKMMESGIMKNAVTGLTALFESRKIRQKPEKEPELERMAIGNGFKITLTPTEARISFDCDQNMQSHLLCKSITIRITDFQMPNLFDNPKELKREMEGLVLQKIITLLESNWRDTGHDVQAERAGILRISKKILWKLENPEEGIEKISDASETLKGILGKKEDLAQK
ncbi:MAG: hypothetical protein ABII22_01875 [Candidatus Micrarchaeota archaeon]